MNPRPESYAAVPGDFPGPVLIEVRADCREKNGRFWKTEGAGLTDNPLEAEVFTADEARALLFRDSDGGDYPVSAALVLADEEARLSAFRERIAAVGGGK